MTKPEPSVLLPEKARASQKQGLDEEKCQIFQYSALEKKSLVFANKVEACASTKIFAPIYINIY